MTGGARLLKSSLEKLVRKGEVSISRKYLSSKLLIIENELRREMLVDIKEYAEHFKFLFFRLSPLSVFVRFIVLLFVRLKRWEYSAGS